MAKNDFLARIRREQAVAMYNARLFTIQLCKDIMLIAANDEFGFGRDRLKRLSDAFDAVMMENAEMVLEDSKSDQELWYSKEKLDQRLKELCGDDFVEWEERYKWKY